MANKFESKEELPSKCEKCPYYKHADKHYCYNPPDDALPQVEARVVPDPKRRASWCQLENELEAQGG